MLEQSRRKRRNGPAEFINREVLTDRKLKLTGCVGHSLQRNTMVHSMTPRNIWHMSVYWGQREAATSRRSWHIKQLGTYFNIPQHKHCKDGQVRHTANVIVNIQKWRHHDYCLTVSIQSSRRVDEFFYFGPVSRHQSSSRLDLFCVSWRHYSTDSRGAQTTSMTTRVCQTQSTQRSRTLKRREKKRFLLVRQWNLLSIWF